MPSHGGSTVDRGLSSTDAYCYDFGPGEFEAACRSLDAPKASPKSSMPSQPPASSSVGDLNLPVGASSSGQGNREPAKAKGKAKAAQAKARQAQEAMAAAQHRIVRSTKGYLAHAAPAASAQARTDKEAAAVIQRSTQQFLKEIEEEQEQDKSAGQRTQEAAAQALAKLAQWDVELEAPDAEEPNESPRLHRRAHA